MTETDLAKNYIEKLSSVNTEFWAFEWHEGRHGVVKAVVGMPADR
jgi:hypothetical protein